MKHVCPIYSLAQNQLSGSKAHFGVISNIFATLCLTVNTNLGFVYINIII